MPDSSEELVKGFLAAVENSDWSALDVLVHDDFFMEWPQSGERFRGRANAIGAMSAQTTKPSHAGESVVLGSGDVWVMMLPLRYGDDIYHYVGIFKVDDGRIRSATEFFGAPFPAPEFRAQFTDRD